MDDIRSSVSTLVSERQAAKILGVTVYAMRAWRHRQTPPAWVHIGRLVRYRVADLEEFINSGRVWVK